MRFMAADVANATGGALIGQNAHLSGVSFDSRTITPGQLFVPIVAERDGHEFIEVALKSGAGAYLTQHNPVGRTAIVVDDTLSALLKLGGWARARLEPTVGSKVIGITGSVGKTSTKDFIAAALSSELIVSASERSFNNDQGLPVTLLNAADNSQALVLEMGMRGFGEIARLCSIAQPNIGVVTAVAAAHTERVGGIEGVAKAKAEMVQALSSSGYAILNADDERVRNMGSLTQAQVLTYGVHESADVRIITCELDEMARASVTATTPWGTVSWAMSVPGAHMALNAVAAIAVSGVCGVNIHSAAAALEQSFVSPMRMQVMTTDDGMTIVNDAYNANPASMRAALDTLVGIKASRHIVIAGQMAELADSSSEHSAIVEYARSKKIEFIACETDNYATPSFSVDDVVQAVRNGGSDVAVLIKGSRVAQLERVVLLLTD
ncbi:MAG: UDP-N-acetylmuramoyl-tripeptide--D-alanyl-D-alanine ligase [Actinobacteria bacterium]|nr:UDP-N-acetylmuramoyl-tripeptide--D-alanyl-D-alanine ligase [Actinomycetota bacterium]MDA2951974.1 UDP-N-acetylmuramoyl-tripeptide--D-alanyl-D-alanine ligase [Actinomycetota bacterium]MDA2999490.1 UDP-N-acetylmuramoyl-tripeptide--D-alanyl-D-alanine ligase [Actinomycetota bacterium]